MQEFQVVSNNYSAEFGHATGGVVNTVPAAAANDLHGTAYWFFRNQDFNAKDTFATINPLESRNQFGASAGGKIIKDKLFYFLNYEGMRRDFPLIANITSPGNPLFDSAGKFNGNCSRPSGRTPPPLNATPRFTSSIASSKPSPVPPLRTWVCQTRLAPHGA